VQRLPALGKPPLATPPATRTASRRRRPLVAKVSTVDIRKLARECVPCRDPGLRVCLRPEGQGAGCLVNGSTADGYGLATCIPVVLYVLHSTFKQRGAKVILRVCEFSRHFATCSVEGVNFSQFSKFLNLEFQIFGSNLDFKFNQFDFTST
jgi:hypothetical protein